MIPARFVMLQASLTTVDHTTSETVRTERVTPDRECKQQTSEHVNVIRVCKRRSAFSVHVDAGKPQ